MRLPALLRKILRHLAAECLARKLTLRAFPRSFKDAKEFVASLAKPRKLMFLVTAGPTVDKVIATFAELLEEGDMLIDGGNEWCAAPPPSPQALAPSPSPLLAGSGSPPACPAQVRELRAPCR